MSVYRKKDTNTGLVPLRSRLSDGKKSKSGSRQELSSEIELPSPQTRRWVKSRKAAVVRAVEEGVISYECALSLYNLSEQELESWFRMFRKHGENALCITQLNHYRKIEKKRMQFQLIEGNK